MEREEERESEVGGKKGEREWREGGRGREGRRERESGGGRERGKGGSERE